MLYTIENTALRVSVDTSGAELQSVYSKKTNTEYLWQGDSAYWSGRAINLFPFIGRRFKSIYSHDGQLYKSRTHGLARYYVFRLEERSATRLQMVFTENEETLQEYPFRFEFRVIFELEGNVLTVRYHVTNTDGKTLICSFGGHPGINIPFGEGEFEDYYAEFSDTTNVHRHLLSDSNTFMANNAVPYEMVDGTKIPLQHALFKNDAVILGNTSRKISLKSAKERRYVSMDFTDFTFIGLWHPGDTNAPFVCLEPWGSLPATDGIVERLEEKEHMLHVAPNKTAQASYTIEIHE